jgi:hypothetical protein
MRQKNKFLNDTAVKIFKLDNSLCNQSSESPDLKTEQVTMCCLLRAIGEYGAMAEW